MNTQDTITTFIERIQALLPGISPELIRMTGAGLLGLLALILLFIAIKLLRRPKVRNSSSSRTDIPRALQQKGVVIDVMTSAKSEKVSVRCVITSVKTSRITCEIIDRLDVIKTRQGKIVTCVFAPLKTKGGKINSFTAKLIESDKTGKRPDRLVLSRPTAFAMIARRKHTRKRVADQQFIRVKMWVEDPEISDISFEDAVAQIGVNSYSNETPDQGANGVINISGGGLGLSILNRLIPETCAEGSPVVINLFMFNFRKKTFKPYWYAGTVRSLKEGRPGFTRMGVEFHSTGNPDPVTGRLIWSPL